MAPTTGPVKYMGNQTKRNSIGMPYRMMWPCWACAESCAWSSRSLSGPMAMRWREERTKSG